MKNNLRNKLFAVPLLIMSVALSATAGGVPSTDTCTTDSEVLASAPLQMYLPDGFTEQKVGQAYLVSRKTICSSGEYEVIDVNIQLVDELKPYGIKIKDTITAFDSSASVDFRLKQLVNSTESFSASTYGTTKITHFGGVGLLNISVMQPPVLFWMNTTSSIGNLVSAQSNGQADDNRPLRCSIEKAFVRLTKKADASNGLPRDLNLTAIFQGSLQLCL